MPFVVVYDACVLYPANLRDFLLRLAGSHLFQAKMSAMILDEMFTALHAQRPDIPTERLARTRRRMEAAVRDGVVSGFED